MASRRKYQSIQGLAESAELIVPEDPTEDQSAMGKEIASEPKPASIPEPISKPERENQNDYESALDRDADPHPTELQEFAYSVPDLRRIPAPDTSDSYSRGNTYYKCYK